MFVIDPSTAIRLAETISNDRIREAGAERRARLARPKGRRNPA